MDIERIATVVPVDDLPAAVQAWTGLLGAEPTFVDGDRWAQFDVAGSRIALSGADQVTDGVALLLRVPDLERARAQATASGLRTGEITNGPHERRCVVRTAEGVEIVLHSPFGR